MAKTTTVERELKLEFGTAVPNQSVNITVKGAKEAIDGEPVLNF